MAYTKIEKSELDLGDEQPVSLDGVGLVAVRCSAQRDAITQSVVFSARARLIDSAGNSKLDAHGQEIHSEATHTSSPTELGRLSTSGVAREMLLLVLGEPATTDADGAALIQFSVDLRACASIKAAATAAEAAETATDISGIL